MSMSPRAIIAAASLAALVGPLGRSAAQMPPEAAPLGGDFRTAQAPNPYYAAQPNFLPPTTAAPPGAMMPGAPPPGYYSGPPLPSDVVGAGPGISRGPQAYVGAEYLLFWVKNAPLPFPVATVGPAGGNAALGAPGTQLLYGNGDINFSSMSGVRAVAGVWLTNNESFGLEGNFFILPKKTGGSPPLQGTDLLPTLARPFFDTASNIPNSLVVNQPGSFQGAITTTGSLQLWGAELGPVWRAIDRGRWTLDTGAAFKFLSLDESLIINSTSNALPGGISVLQGRAIGSPSTLTVIDDFRTTNNFYGGTLMLRSNVHVEAFTWSLAGKLGLGVMDSTLQVNGSSTVTTPTTPPLTSGGGLLASGANVGTYHTNQFSLIPEFYTNINVQLTSHIAVNLGYNLLFMNKVLRPGNQISTNINPNGVPSSPNFGARLGPTGSTVPVSTTDFWAQGFNLGVVVGY
ncbi:MAG TPA: BBP7 family outer membrane beta-barrel protein [Urbifossiella sp.]|nr:BBP7 family outer membrane beta-barrel protein [Urbifossiella sp.]